MANGKNILVPVSGDSSDAEALRMACRLAQESKAKIFAIYVIEVNRALPVDAVLETEVKKGEDIIDKAERIADEADEEVEGAILQAREAGPAIVEEAEDKGVDLIVIGLPYKIRFGTFSLGDTISYVLKNASCGVVLCRSSLS
ncbi:MAG: universal stress protein [Chloroflexota bacterium]